MRNMHILLPLHFVWCAFAAPVVARQQRQPVAAAAWLLCLAALPFVGTLLYLLAAWRPYRPAVPCGGSEALPLASLIRSNCGARIARHNRTTPLRNGSNAFSALIAALQHAARSIHMEYYIFRDDRIGRAVAEILVRKARAGVEVRVIYDAVGSWRLSRRTLRRLREAGVDIRPFAPIRFPWFTPRAARRNHRKIVVTDGKVAFIGGINIAKYYLDGDCMGKWRDEHLRIEGDAVADLQRIFLTDWAHAGGRRLAIGRYVARHRIFRISPMQIAPAEEGRTRRTLIEAFAAAIAGARREVRISSPYFMPPPLLLDAIRMAAGCGVRVRVITPMRSDSRLTGLVAESYVGELLDAGAEVYRYADGFLHAKMALFDDAAASVGTANMDYRSLTDNFEVTAFLYDRRLVRRLAAEFDADLALSHRVSRRAWRRRPRWRILLCDLARLLAPLL